jgi:hypothetical protein
LKALGCMVERVAILLARVLLRLAQFGNDGKSQGPIPKITQETVVEMV